MTATQKVRVETTRFGAIEAEEDLIITLPEGLIGFDDCRRYIVLRHDDRSPFRWLQSLDDGSVAFPVMEPHNFLPDYNPRVSDADAAELGLQPDAAPLVFTVITVPRMNPRAMTANLLGPVVVNARTRVGKQVVLDDDRYTTRFDLLPALSAALTSAA